VPSVGPASPEVEAPCFLTRIKDFPSPLREDWRPTHGKAGRKPATGGGFPKGRYIPSSTLNTWRKL
jgi:hypothetical protein